MIDEFAGQRFPDLPNAGYSTYREQQLSDAMMFFIRGVERDRAFHLMIVIEGYDLFLTRMRATWKAFGVSDDDIRGTFRYLVTMAGRDPQGQLSQLMKILPPVKSYTPQEIQDIARRGQ